MKTKILVTGANGQLGKTLNELSSIHKEELQFIFTTKEELDITEEHKVQDYFSKNKFDYCINCAAYTNVDQAELDSKSAFKVNAEGVKYLAESCKDTNTILIHISTDYVFDGTKNKPYTEEDETNPINEYGKSKLLGEQYIQGILQECFIIRTSWLYSKKHGKNFYKTILQKAKNDEQLKIINNQIGCPTDCVNLAILMLKIVTHNHTKYGIHHFCDEQQMTWFSFAKQILKENNLLTSTKLIRHNNYDTLALRPINSILKNSNNILS